MATYFITGATGTLGYALSNLLTYHGHEVVIGLHASSNRSVNFKKKFNFKTVDFDINNLEGFVFPDNVDHVVHFAWNGGLDRLNDVPNYASYIATIKLFEMCVLQSVKSFMGFGSLAEYGATSKIITEKLEENPITEFGKYKLKTYKSLENISKMNSTKFYWMRVLSAYGRNDRSSSMIMTSLNTLINGEFPRLSSGNYYWDFVNSEDIALAILKITEVLPSNILYVIGAGEHLLLKDYVQIISSYFSVKPEQMLGQIADPDPLIEIRCKPTRLENDVGWTPSVPFEEGIGRIIDELKSNAHS